MSGILPDFMIRDLRVGEGRHVVEPFIERTPINGLSGRSRGQT